MDMRPGTAEYIGESLKCLAVMLPSHKLMLMPTSSTSAHPISLLDDVKYKSEWIVRTYQHVSIEGKGRIEVTLDIPSKLWDRIMSPLRNGMHYLELADVIVRVKTNEDGDTEAWIVSADYLRATCYVGIGREMRFCNPERRPILFDDLKKEWERDRWQFIDPYQREFDDYTPSVADYYDDVGDLEMNTRGDGFD